MAELTNEDFVNFLLKKSKQKKEETAPQSRTGTREGVDRKEVEDALKSIQDKLQKSK